MSDVRLILGNSLNVLPTLASGSVDAVVTDPPAGISFMGKTWDKPGVLGVSGGKASPSTTSNRNPSCRTCGGRKRAGAATKPCSCDEPDWNDYEYRTKDRSAFITFLSAVMAECFRVAKPSAYALVWALPRTSHWTGTAIEDAGWVIQDRISHLFGTGFPKHKSKLKPACEDWWLAWKPDQHATPLQIEACRIGTEMIETRECSFAATNRKVKEQGCRPYHAGIPSQGTTGNIHSGRWPANVVLSHTPECVQVGTTTEQRSVIESTPKNGKYKGEFRCGSKSNGTTEQTCERWACVPECPVRMLDGQSGESSDRPAKYALSGEGIQDPEGRLTYSKGWNGATCKTGYQTSGGASRFFYCSKASRRDRGEGNTHPTVKPSALMRWLCRLITPPGGLILDPFAGSGSTLLAARAEGFRAVGVEKDPTYFAIAEKRIAAERSANLFAELR